MIARFHKNINVWIISGFIKTVKTAGHLIYCTKGVRQTIQSFKVKVTSQQNSAIVPSCNVHYALSVNQTSYTDDSPPRCLQIYAPHRYNLFWPHVPHYIKGIRTFIFLGYVLAPLSLPISDAYMFVYMIFAN